MLASVSPGISLLCRNPARCWNFSASRDFSPPGTFLTIEADAEIEGQHTISRPRSGFVDFCINSDMGCPDPSLCQPEPVGHAPRQNRWCVTKADGCSNPIFPLDPDRAHDPTQGTLGLSSTAFGQDEEGLPEGAPTVFGQRRPIQLPCNRHDTCSSYTCPQFRSRVGYVQHRLGCDFAFYQDMNAVCKRAYPETLCPADRIGVATCPLWVAEKTNCYQWAFLYWIAVSGFSETFLSQEIFPEIKLERCIDCPIVLTE
jgi:hypothetical protein